jgi:hypothetical protein
LVVEDNVGQSRAIYSPVFVQDFCAPTVHHGLVNRLAWFLQFANDGVGIYQNRSALYEQEGYRRFSRTYATGQSDLKHGLRLDWGSHA